MSFTLKLFIRRASLLFGWILKMRSHSAAHVGFKFPGSTDPPALASLASGTTGANYSAQLIRKKAL